MWEAATSFCEAVMLAKEGAEYERERLAEGKARCAERHATISGHRRRGLAGGEQQVVRRPITTEPVSTARCVPRVPQGAVSTHCRGPVSGQLSAGVAGSARTRHRALGH